MTERHSASGVGGNAAAVRTEHATRSGRVAMIVVGLIGVALVTLALVIAVGRRPAEAPMDEVTHAVERIPPELAEDVATLMGSERRKERDLAAERVLSRARTAGMTLPAYVTGVAALQAARGCAGKKAALAEVVALGDPRVVPALERLARSPKYGCGEAHEQDCLACVRDDLDSALRTFGIDRAGQ